jgi:hypothetical protein
MTRAERLIVLIGLIALITVPSTLLYMNGRGGTPTTATSTSDQIPTPGSPGAQHWHASLLVSINDKVIDFKDPKYMLQSKLVHFEDNNPFFVHKHTTGITIPYFLSTLKIFMQNDCIDFEDGDTPLKYCTNATSSLHMLVNGTEVPDPARYEIQNNDRILVMYGSAKGAQLKLLANQVPEVPEFRELTLTELQQGVQQ